MLMHTHIVSAARYYSQGASAAAAYQVHLRRVRPGIRVKGRYLFIFSPSCPPLLLLSLLILRGSDQSRVKKKKEKKEKS